MCSTERGEGGQLVIIPPNQKLLTVKQIQQNKVQNKRKDVALETTATLLTTSPKGFVGAEISTQFKWRLVLEERYFVGYQTYKSYQAQEAFFAECDWRKLLRRNTTEVCSILSLPQASVYGHYCFSSPIQHLLCQGKHYLVEGGSREDHQVTGRVYPTLFLQGMVIIRDRTLGQTKESSQGLYCPQPVKQSIFQTHNETIWK